MNGGMEHAPIDTIKEALTRTQPGATVYASPERYLKSPRPVRPGAAIGAPPFPGDGRPFSAFGHRYYIRIEVLN